jgi:RNA polymerase sigma-70 factor (ECF subfamily)
MLSPGYAAVKDHVARFNRLFDQNNQAVLGYLARRTEQVADAADLLAEVFLVAWKKIDKVPESGEERLWLFGVARNTVRNYKRSGLRRHALAEQLRQHIRASSEFDSSIRPDVRKALLQLSDRDRELLMLTAWDGFTPTEVAQLLRVPPNRVRVRLHRAKGRLAERLGLALPGADDIHERVGKAEEAAQIRP